MGESVACWEIELSNIKTMATFGKLRNFITYIKKAVFQFFLKIIIGNRKVRDDSE